MKLRLVVLLAALVAVSASGISSADLQRLASAAGTTVQIVCSALEATHGYDVCGALNPPSPSPPAPGPSTSICQQFNYDDPGDNSTVFAYLSEALLVNPVGCFATFNTYCNFTYDTASEQLEAFSNWTLSYQELYTYLQDPEATLVSPSCFDIYTEEESVAYLTGTQSAVPQRSCAGFPGITASTPQVTDWKAKGIIGPVTSQAGGTCYVHAAVGWAESYLLLRNISDQSGQFLLTDQSILSVQPLVDCYGFSNCTSGGLPSDVVNTLKANATTTTDRFPYQMGSVAGVTNSASCFTPNNAQCASLAANSTLLYSLPVSVTQEICTLSQSQLVQFLATQGPIIAAYSSGGLAENWEPFQDKANTIPNPWDGRIGERGPSFCDNEINHAVILTGYNMTDPDNSYFIYRNSWGTVGIGLDGYYFAKMSNPASTNFSDPNYEGTCGMTQQLTFWSD